MADSQALATSLDSLKSALEKANALKSLGKESQSIEQRMLVAELIEKLLETKEKILQAKEELLSIPAGSGAEAAQASIEFDGLIYWKVLPTGKKEGPFCQRCQDLEQRWIRLQEESQTQDFGTTLRKFYSCKVCKTTYDVR